MAALNALPSLCIGRSPEEVLEIVLDALPTALGCDLLYLQLPTSRLKERGSFRREPLTESELDEIRRVALSDDDGADAQLFLEVGKVWCIEAEIPIGGGRGRLVAGRSSALDAETDRLLVRTAANAVGTIIETANVLEGARRKDDFLAMLGHELRNPLAPIITAVELLGRHPAAARERDVIERHARHLTRLVDDLLDIARVTRGEVPLRKEVVPLGSVLERAVEIASPLVAQNRHELRVAHVGDVMLQGDPVRLAQVFGNLLTNAAKFTPIGGLIEVIVAVLDVAGPAAPGRVRIIVRDNGIGIERAHVDRIFQPFVQADREGDPLRGGLGLGLAIVSNLVQRHGGSIAAESGGKGQGAAFTVELPTIAAKAEPREAARPRLERARAGVRVLVVDDNVDVAELLSEALQDEGFDTAVAYDGPGALVRWRSFSPHVGVLDVGLPGLDGYQLARALRAEHGTSATLIAATGYGQPADRLRAADAGFDCHLVKPVSVRELVVILDERVVTSRSENVLDA